MKLDNGRAFRAAALFAATALIIAAYLAEPYFNEYSVLFLFAVNAVILLLVALYLRSRSDAKCARNNILAKKAIDSVRTGAFEKTENGGDLSGIYDSLDELSQSLRNRDRGRNEILGIINSVASNMELEKLLEALLPKLLENLQSSWGAFYLANNATNKLEIKASYGFSRNIYGEFDLSIGEGLVGGAAMRRETVIISDLPDDTVYITKTFLGNVKPKNLMLVPIINQDQLMGVLALGSLYEYTGAEMELVDLIKYYIGAAVGNGVIYERSKRLTNEYKFQNKLIQDLNNELETKINERGLFLNNLMNSISDYAIYAIDTEGSVLTWNSGAERLYGYTAAEIVGRNISLIYPAEEAATGAVRLRIDTAVRNGRYSEEGWRVKRDGSSYYAEVSLFAMRGANGETIGVTNVTRDITELATAKGEPTDDRGSR